MVRKGHYKGKAFPEVIYTVLPLNLCYSVKAGKRKYIHIRWESYAHWQEKD